GGKNSLNRLIRCVCGKKIGPDPRNFNQRVSLGRNDLLIRTFPNSHAKSPEFLSTASNFVVFFHYRNGVMAHCLIGRPYPDGSFGFSQTI
ncbi:hypothetical protein, partial [Klebsiella pneumoniae]